MIGTLMLFAAGLGNRMRHLTKNNPKALVQVLDKPVLHYALELTKLYPFKHIVINTHYMHQDIKNSLKQFQKIHSELPKVTFIYEKEFLETGGAIKNASSVLGNEPIFALNTDVILRPEYDIFSEMIDRWDEKKMDFLLLMQKYENIVGYHGYGDFDLDNENKLVREDKEGHYDYIFTGLQILKPYQIAKHPLKIFSLKEYYLNSQKVRGMKAKNLKWYYIKSPEDLVDIEMDML